MLQCRARPRPLCDCVRGVGCVKHRRHPAGRLPIGWPPLFCSSPDAARMATAAVTFGPFGLLPTSAQSLMLNSAIRLGSARLAHAALVLYSAMQPRMRVRWGQACSNCDRWCRPMDCSVRWATASCGSVCVWFEPLLRPHIAPASRAPAAGAPGFRARRFGVASVNAVVACLFAHAPA